MVGKIPQGRKKFSHGREKYSKEEKISFACIISHGRRKTSQGRLKYPIPW